MYALIHENRLILGPMNFNIRYFNSELEDLGINYRVSSNTPSQVPFHINDETHILPVREEVPDHDPRFFKTLSFSWEIIKDESNIPIEMLLTHTITEKTLDEVKNEIKQRIKPIRQNKENVMIEVDIDGTKVNVSTSRESRLEYVSKLISSSGIHNFKFANDIWLQINKTNLEYIISQIDAHVQSQYDWELSKINEIDSCTTPEQVYSVEIIDKSDLFVKPIVA